MDPFIEEYCKDAVALDHGLDVQKFGVRSVTFPGLYIELGVCAGGSINHIASLVPFQFIYGFDSFDGLPDDWDKGKGDFTPKGSWARDRLPYVLPNIRLIKGWFKDTLPEFVKKMGPDEPIAFLHVDCDLYSSTACALNALAPLIQEGTIIVFDEFYNYPNYKNHEWKALNEFLEAYSFKAEYLAYCRSHEQVALRILRAH
ncbi:MAG TPA: TylF/MycF/NovP-related O-methyltransferase [Rhabdochlamydiaceae bacterium]|nr:TylF/MycF/NovP-related O-methyltransferase [Rhabdochlamydiaceae bacterium]